MRMQRNGKSRKEGSEKGALRMPSALDFCQERRKFPLFLRKRPAGGFSKFPVLIYWGRFTMPCMQMHAGNGEMPGMDPHWGRAFSCFSNFSI